MFTSVQNVNGDMLNTKYLTLYSTLMQRIQNILIILEVNK